MKIKKIDNTDKLKLKKLISEVIADQGLLAQFYWPVDLVEAELASAESVGIVEEDSLIAVILYRILPQAWEISLVTSHPLRRRLGYVEDLLHHLIAARGQGIELWLEVHEENISAQKLYEKMGFREVGRRPKYYKDLGTAILYALK